jgi:hypothetical protein
VVISLGLGYVATKAEERPNEILSLGILDKNMGTSNYFTEGNRQVALNESVNWNLHVYNGMGAGELLSLRLKILNSTQLLPNDSFHSPSPVTQILEIQHAVAHNSTWILPLEWSITNIDREGQSVLIREMKINSEDIRDLNIRGTSDESMFMVIELWKYNPQLQDFEFGWRSSTNTEEEKSVWTKIEFRIQ